MNDTEYIDEFYAGSSKKRDKYRRITMATSKYGIQTFYKQYLLGIRYQVGCHNDTSWTSPHEKGATKIPFFPKASIQGLETMIRDIVLRFLNRMNLCGRSKEKMSMNLVYKMWLWKIDKLCGHWRLRSCLPRSHRQCCWICSLGGSCRMARLTSGTYHCKFSLDGYLQLRISWSYAWLTHPTKLWPKTSINR